MRTAAVDWRADDTDVSDVDSHSGDDSIHSSTSKNINRCTDYILGFEDGPMTRASDQRDWNLSRLAGKPAWLPFKKKRIPSDELNCSNCGRPFYLITQVYSVNDLKDVFDRVLYLFGCGDSSCQALAKKSSSPYPCLRAFRSWQLNYTYQAKVQSDQRVPARDPDSLIDNPFKLKADSKNWHTLTTGDIFDIPDIFPNSPVLPSNDKNSTPTSPPKHELVSKSTSQPQLDPQPGASQSEPDKEPDLPSLAACYLTTSYECRPFTTLTKRFASLTVSPAAASSSRKLEDKLDRADSKRQSKVENEEQGGWKGERYERQTIEGVDAAFLAFQDRVSWCGQSNQVIRYKFGGKPLPFARLASSPTRIHCEKCGSPKAFELQFMPVGVSLLNRAMPNDRGFAWSTAWLLTCVKDCHGVKDVDEEGWVEESVFVQWDD